MTESPFRPGDRVRIKRAVSQGLTGPVLRGPTGTVRRPTTLLWARGWVVELDQPTTKGGTISVRDRQLRLLNAPEFRVGDRVTINSRLLHGWTGRLVRPAHLLWKPAWLVEIDGGTTIKRTRVATRALIPLDRNN